LLEILILDFTEDHKCPIITKRLQKMKKYNDEHFTVRERRTHKKICDCGSFEDARMMMGMDGPNREIVKKQGYDGTGSGY
jgi:hypothetical protein